MTADLCEKCLHFMYWRKICRIFLLFHRSTFQNVLDFFSQICCHFQPCISRLSGWNIFFFYFRWESRRFVKCSSRFGRKMVYYHQSWTGSIKLYQTGREWRYHSWLGKKEEDLRLTFLRHVGYTEADHPQYQNVSLRRKTLEGKTGVWMCFRLVSTGERARLRFVYFED